MRSNDANTIITSSQIVSAQENAAHTGYLPLVLKSGSNAPAIYLFHQDKLHSTPPKAYIFKIWEYNGRKNFAEAIYTGLAADFDGVSATSDSYLILVHTPQK